MVYFFKEFFSISWNLFISKGKNKLSSLDINILTRILSNKILSNYFIPDIKDFDAKSMFTPRTQIKLTERSESAPWVPNDLLQYISNAKRYKLLAKANKIPPLPIKKKEEPGRYTMKTSSDNPKLFRLKIF